MFEDFNIGELPPKEIIRFENAKFCYIFFRRGRLEIIHSLRHRSLCVLNEWMKIYKLLRIRYELATIKWQYLFWANLLKIMILMIKKIWEFGLFTKSTFIVLGKIKAWFFHDVSRGYYWLAGLYSRISILQIFLFIEIFWWLYFPKFNLIYINEGNGRKS